jgi:antitoxin CptB
MAQLPSDRAQRDLSDVRCRRLLFRCWNHGTQKSGLIFGPFAGTSLANLENTQLARFETLLDCSGPDLSGWIIAGIKPPPEHSHDVLRLLRDFSVACHRKPPQNTRHQI